MRLLAPFSVPSADRLVEVIILGRGIVQLFVMVNTGSPFEDF